MTEEEFLRERLWVLYESYLKDAQPIIDRLVRIESLRRPSPVILQFEQVQAMLGAAKELKT